MSSTMKNMVKRAVRTCPADSYAKAKQQMFAGARDHIRGQVRDRNAIPSDFDARTASRSDYEKARAKLFRHSEASR